MIFRKAALPLVFLASANVSLAQNEAANLMGIIQQKVSKVSGNLRRGLGKVSDDDSDIDICDFVERNFASPFHNGPPNSGCDCDGTLESTTTLDCVFEDVCDEYGVLCADLQVNATMTGILDKDGDFGKDPHLGLAVCMNMESPVTLPAPLCFTMNFTKPDIFLPSACSFSYGESECECIVDKSVPCYKFDCSNVTPGIASKSCQEFDLTNILDPMMLLPVLADVPEDFDDTLGDKEEHLIATAVNRAKIVEQVKDYRENVGEKN